MMQPSIDDQPFWAEAQGFMTKYEFDEAEKIYRDALSKHINHPKIMDALGDCLLQKGDHKQAKQILTISMKLAPNVGQERYFNLAQLSEGKEAVEYSRKGIEIITGILNQPETVHVEKVELQNSLISALCAIIEVYMTDLCYEPEAESECMKLIEQALTVDPNSVEALQVMASIKISQQFPDEALEFLKKSYEQWKDFEFEQMPSFEFRSTAAKLFLELENSEIAADILCDLLNEDDEISELWYLHAFSLSELDPEGAIESLTKARELLDKFGCQDQSFYERIDQLAEMLKECGGNGNDDGGMEVEGSKMG